MQPDEKTHNKIKGFLASIAWGTGVPLSVTLLTNVISLVTGMVIIANQFNPRVSALELSDITQTTAIDGLKTSLDTVDRATFANTVELRALTNFFIPASQREQLMKEAEEQIRDELGLEDLE